MSSFLNHLYIICLFFICWFWFDFSPEEKSLLRVPHSYLCRLILTSSWPESSHMLTPNQSLSEEKWISMIGFKYIYSRKLRGGSLSPSTLVFDDKQWIHLCEKRKHEWPLGQQQSLLCLVACLPQDNGNRPPWMRTVRGSSSEQT